MERSQALFTFIEGFVVERQIREKLAGEKTQGDQFARCTSSLRRTLFLAAKFMVTIYLALGFCTNQRDTARAARPEPKWLAQGFG